MALRCSSSASAPPFMFNSNVAVKQSFSSVSISFTNPKFYPSIRINCHAAKSVNNQKSSSSKKKKKKKNSVVEFDGSDNSNKDYEVLREFPVEAAEADVQNFSTILDSPLKYDDEDMLLPRPPAGFSVDDDGVVSITSNNRIVTIIDPENNLPLECLIRRVFKSSEREECMLVCPVDTPMYILKNTPDGMSPISDEEEVESILAVAAFALAKIHMHLVYSGYFYTARGGFCYTEQDKIGFHTDDGEDIEGLPSDGVGITYFELEGSTYLIYTSSKPLQFVVVKGENGMFQMADDDLVEDYAVIDAIDEEFEFNALVVEEAAFIEGMLDESDSENDSENEI
ncbi:uncharacterized protein LOC131602883 [Vicia villosa]|uniref:uncharacterized protein LOC131602883 n=1 Tax=Vicia villosa TaxID=3911 RepID=UPI00273CA358|nr:uncharacterized protein LOC131602883 [Vicia villosa]